MILPENIRNIFDEIHEEELKIDHESYSQYFVYLYFVKDVRFFEVVIPYFAGFLDDESVLQWEVDNFFKNIAFNPDYKDDDRSFQTVVNAKIHSNMRRLFLLGLADFYKKTDLQEELYRQVNDDTFDHDYAVDNFSSYCIASTAYDDFIFHKEHCQPGEKSGVCFWS